MFLQGAMQSHFITVRARQYFHKRLSFCPQEGCLHQCMLGYTPPSQTAPPGRHPEADIPQADTSRADTPLCSLLLLSASLLLALLALVLSSPSSAGTAFEHSFKDRNFNFCGYVPTDVHQILLFKNLVEFLYSKLFLSNMCIDSFFKCTDFKFAINKVIEGA